MKITSYNRSAGRRAKEKVHTLDGEGSGIAVGYSRDGMTGRTLPGRHITLEFDGRFYLVEMTDDEFARFKENVNRAV